VGLIMSRSLRATGDTAAGWAYLRRLDGQTKEYLQNPALVSEKIARQEALVTVWDLPDVLISRRRGMPVGYVFRAAARSRSKTESRWCAGASTWTWRAPSSNSPAAPTCSSPPRARCTGSRRGSTCRPTHFPTG